LARNVFFQSLAQRRKERKESAKKRAATEQVDSTTALRGLRPMTAPLFCLCLLASATPADDSAPARPGVVALLAGEDAYQAAKGTETIHEGVIERNTATGLIGTPARFNSYRLTVQDGTGKSITRDLYVPGKEYLLAPHVGQRVRVVGKVVVTEAGGKTYTELWPARLESLSAALADAPGADGVFARCTWQPAEAQRRGARHYVFRDGRQLARVMGLSGESADETAAKLLAQNLSVPALDWKKFMAVTVCAGLKGPEADRLTITRVAVDGDTLTVRYRLSASPGAAGIGYPAETVLVERFDGPVRVEEEKGPRPEKREGR
jgi:hypothetical protein